MMEIRLFYDELCYSWGTISFGMALEVLLKHPMAYPVDGLQGQENW